MKLFLTGGTGFIGQPLTQNFLDRGWEVIALVRNIDSLSARSLAKMGAQCIVGDVIDRESMRPGMVGADVVIHNAAWYELGVTKNAQRTMFDINVNGTENVLGLALELGIVRIVYVSSCVYFGDTGSETRDETYKRQYPVRFYYEQSKMEAHDVAQKYQKQGLPLVIVCPAHVLGPNDHSVFGYYLRMYLNKMMVPFGFSPETMISPAHVNDIANGIALAVERGRIGETYILAGDSMSLREVFEIWNTKKGGFKIRYYIPRWVAKLMFTLLEPMQRQVGLPAFISRESVDSSGSSYSFSSAKAQKELGWTYLPAKDMWSIIVEKELELKNTRIKKDFVSRMKPVELESGAIVAD